MSLLNTLKDKIHDLASTEKKIGTQEDNSSLRRGITSQIKSIVTMFDNAKRNIEVFMQLHGDNIEEERRLKALKSTFTTNFDNMKTQFQDIAKRVHEATQRYIELAKKSIAIKSSQINKELYQSSNAEQKQEIVQIQVKYMVTQNGRI